jgi:hypothetical protein
VAVVNKDFDYVAYLDALKAYGLNYTRIYAGAMFEVTPGNYVENLGLGLPGGTYKADWVDPASGSVLGSETFTHHGGNRTFTTPTHVVDIALRIKRN